jgi:hypothetical protein
MIARMTEWTSRHFSLANPKGSPSATDLAVLLRRIADEIDTRQIRPMEILDMTIHSEITAAGPHWSATLYWSPDERPEAS